MFAFLIIQVISANNCSSKSNFTEFKGVYPHSLIALPYENSFLSPFLSEDIVSFHILRHQYYLDRLNSFLINNTQLYSSDLSQLCTLSRNYDLLSKYAGGVYNHNLYWWVLTSPECKKDLGPGTLRDKLEKQWGSFENFLEDFKNQLNGYLGTGWGWVCMNLYGVVEIRITKNEINPLMSISGSMCYPFIACDIWEHAFHLDYNWDKQEYIEMFFEAIDWDVVEMFYESFSSNLDPVPF